MRALVLGVVALLAACGSETPMSAFPQGPAPTPDAPQVVPGLATGPTQIAFVSADPPPGSAVSGCGTLATGCPGRLRMVFRVIPAATGTALRFVVALNSTAKRTCFLAVSGPFTLNAAEARVLQVVLDPSDTCAVPLTITDLSANLEGAVDLASRQEWSIGYTFAP